MKKAMSALIVCLVMAPAMAQAATCALNSDKTKWQCGGATLKAAKDACNATTGDFNHDCDEGINVCTCATKSVGGDRPNYNLQTPKPAGFSFEIRPQRQ